MNLEHMPKTAIIVGGVIVIAIVVIIIGKQQAGSGTVTPTIPGTLPGGGGNTPGTPDYSALLANIATLQTSVNALPKGVDSTQLAQALANLQNAMKTQDTTQITQAEQALMGAIGTMQSTLLANQNTNNAKVLSALSSAMMNMQGTIQGLFQQQQQYLSQQFNNLQQQILPTVSLSQWFNASEWSNAFGKLMGGNPLWNASIVNNNGHLSFNDWVAAMDQWTAGFKSYVPGLTNIPTPYLQNLFYYMFIQNPQTYLNNPNAAANQASYISKWLSSLGTGYIHVTQ